MNAQMLLENFRFIADAPGGVKRFREMILHYAISGALVAQIDSEVNAEKDIERANFLKEEFQRRFKIRNRKPTGSLRKDEIPFSIPTHWIWVRMESIACYIQRGKGPKYAVSGRALVVSQKCVQWSGFDLTPARRISDDSLARYGDERFLKEGDILWNSTGTGTVGRVAICPGYEEPAVADSHVTVIRLTNFIPQYVWCYLASPLIQARMIPNQEGSMVSGTTNQVELSATKVAELPVPCPPLEEQKRIVSKVDELMALCDKLEAQQQKRERRFPALSRACHARFVEAPSLDNLRAVFDGAEGVSPADLLNTILALAVQGMLVSQLASKQSAELLLQFLKKQQSKQFLSEHIRKRSPVPRIKKSDWFFSVPDSWEFPCFDDVAVIVSGVTKGRKFTGRDTITLPYLRVANVQRGHLDLNVIKNIEVLPDDKEKYRLVWGDVLMTEGGDWDKLGRAAIWKEEIANCIHQNHIYRVRSSDKELLLPEWIVIFVNSPVGRGFFENAAKQTTNLASINMTQLRGCPLPLPPTDEQHRIVAEVDQLMALIDQLEKQQTKKSELAQAFAQAAVAAITGTEFKEPEKMKAPKTELVSRLQTNNTPNATDSAPLAKLLTENRGELPAKALWQQSGLDIDAFYQQLRTEIDQGWINKPEPKNAFMKEIETD